MDPLFQIQIGIHMLYFLSATAISLVFKGQDPIMISASFSFRVLFGDIYPNLIKTKLGKDLLQIFENH